MTISRSVVLGRFVDEFGGSDEIISLFEHCDEGCAVGGVPCIRGINWHWDFSEKTIKGKSEKVLHCGLRVDIS